MLWNYDIPEKIITYESNSIKLNLYSTRQEQDLILKTERDQLLNAISNQSSSIDNSTISSLGKLKIVALVSIGEKEGLKMRETRKILKVCGLKRTKNNKKRDKFECDVRIKKVLDYKQKDMTIQGMWNTKSKHKSSLTKIGCC